MTDDERSLRRQRKILVFLLLIAGVVTWVFASISASHKASRHEAERQAEAAQAEIDGLIVAGRVKTDTIQKQAAQIEGFKALPPGKTKEVVKWRTKEIKVPGKTIFRDVIRETPPEDPQQPIDCDLLCPTPDLIFDVRGREARVESNLGNLFAVGEVELWRTSPEPEILLGSAPWEAKLTDYTRSDEREKRDLRRMLALGLTTGPGWTVRYSQRWSRRLGWFLGARGAFSKDLISSAYLIDPGVCRSQRAGQHAECSDPTFGSRVFDASSVDGEAGLTFSF